MFGSAAAAASSARSISRPVMSPACSTRRLEWPPSRPRSNFPAAPSSRVNFTPQSINRLTTGGPSATIVRHDLLVAQPGAGAQRVLDVQLERVVVAHHGGDPALRVVGAALRAVLLGDDRDASVRGDLEREDQAGDPAADHQEVDVVPGGVHGG